MQLSFRGEKLTNYERVTEAAQAEFKNNALAIVDIMSQERMTEERFSSFVKSAELGPFFERFGHIYSVLANSDLSPLAVERLNRIKTAALATRSACDRFRSLLQGDGGLSTVGPELQKIQEELYRLYQQDFSVLAEAYVFVREYWATERNITEIIDQAIAAKTSAIDGLRLKVESLLEKVNGLLSELAPVAEDSAITKNTEFFEREALEHESAAGKWLCATIIVSIAIVCSVIAAWTWLPVYDWLVSSTLRQIAYKVIILSTLYYLLLFAGRNYRSHRHNSVVNRHRSNALKTFHSFAASTSNPTERSAVVMKAAETVFSPITTGYLAKEPESIGGTQVIEVLKDTMNKSQRD